MEKLFEKFIYSWFCTRLEDCGFPQAIYLVGCAFYIPWFSVIIIGIISAKHPFDWVITIASIVYTILVVHMIGSLIKTKHY